MSQRSGRPLKIGLVVPVFEDDDGHTPRWNEIKASAQHAEAAGFDSLWLPDHLIYDYGNSGRPLHGVWECWSILTSLAAVTTRVEIGTTVVCTSFRNPALLAKMADTVDEISGGRLILGLGAGNHEPEFRAFGYPFDHLSGRFEESLQIIRGLLRNGKVDFQGQYYTARECELRPRGPTRLGPPDSDWGAAEPAQSASAGCPVCRLLERLRRQSGGKSKSRAGHLGRGLCQSR